MKRNVIGIILLIISAIIMGTGVFWGFFIYSFTTGKGNNAIIFLCVGVVSTIIAITLLLIGFVLRWMPSKKAKARMSLYYSYPLNKIIDYKRELNEVRINYLADTDPNKNLLPDICKRKEWRGTELYFNSEPIKYGKIYYGSIVEANKWLFKYTTNILPAVVVYSKDNYYDENPLELMKIAKMLFQNKRDNILRNEYKYFLNFQVEPQLTNGRIVFMTTVMIYPSHLPLCHLNDSILPIITDAKQSSSIFVVDAKYWTKNMISNYIHYGYYKDSIDNEKNNEDPFQL